MAKERGRGAFPISLALATGTACLVITAAAQDRTGTHPGPGPLREIGLLRELFLDDSELVESREGIEIVTAQATKVTRDAVIKRDQPWELSGPADYISALYDDEEKLYKMWYGFDIEVPHYPGATSRERVTGYAVSDDGIQWTKPRLTTVTATPTNVVFHGAAGKRWGVPYVVKDYSDADPTKRYKMLFNFWDFQGRGLGYAWSPDGMRWTAHPYTVVQGSFDTQNHFFWDPQHGSWVAYVRSRPYAKRSVARATSPDLFHWSIPVTIERPDERDGPDESLYVPACYRLAKARNVYVMLVSVYDSVKDTAIPQLAVSRDGIHWRRFRKPFIAPGESGSWDSGGGPATASEIPAGNHNLFYYRGVQRHHGENPQEGVGVARIQRDRYVGLHAGPKGGTVTTRLMLLNSKVISPENASFNLNTDAANGRVLVEILDAGGNSVPGFTTEDCVPVTTDAIEHRVRWKNNSTVSPVIGKPVRLRFRIENASIFGFQIIEYPR